MAEIVMQLTADNRKQVFRAMFDRAAGITQAMELVLRERVRSQDQNRKFHPMITDIRRQCFRGHTERGVKAVLVNQFALEMAEIGEPLRHPGETAWDWKHQQAVYIRPSTTEFTKAEAGKFIEWLYATGAELNVEWSEPALAEYQKWIGEKS